MRVTLVFDTHTASLRSENEDGIYGLREVDLHLTSQTVLSLIHFSKHIPHFAKGNAWPGCKEPQAMLSGFIIITEGRIMASSFGGQPELLRRDC